MARNQKLYEIQGGFATGQMSPSSRDSVDLAVWRQGAARLENMNVLKDGALASRRALARGKEPIVIPFPRYGLLTDPTGRAPGAANIGFQIQGTYDPSTGMYDFATAGGTILPPTEEIYTAGDGIWRFNQNLFRGTVPDTNWALLRINLASGYPKSVFLHDVFSRSGSHKTGGDKLTWRVYVKVRGIAGEVGLTPEDQDAAILPGAFDPGPKRRTIRLPVYTVESVREFKKLSGIDPTDVDQSQLDIEYVAIRPATASSTVPIDIHIGGVSAWADKVPATPDPVPPTYKFPFDLVGNATPPRQQYRPYGYAMTRIPWVIRGEPYALFLTMERALMVHIGNAPIETPTVRQNVVDWQFTPEQLRGLENFPYANSQILVHPTFQYPIRVTPPTGEKGRLEFAYLPLNNLPVIPPRLLADAAVDIGPGGVILDVPSVTVGAARPQNLRSTEGKESVTLHWSSTSASNYRLYHRTKASYDDQAAGSEWTGATTVDLLGTVTEYTVENLVAGTEYIFAVSSVDNAVEGSRSLPVTATPIGADLSEIMNLRADVSKTVTRIDYHWDAVTGATSYEIEWRITDSTEVETATVAVPSTTYRIPTVTAEIAYSFRVRARGAHDAASPWAAVAPAIALHPKPAAPTNLRAALDDNNETVVLLEWTRPAGEPDGYEVEYKLSTATRWTTLQVADTDTHRFVGRRNQTYNVRIRSVAGTTTGRNTSVWAPNDNGISITTTLALQPPGNLQATADTMVQGRVHVSWNAAQRATAYSVRYRAGTGAWTVRTLGNVLSWIHNGTAGVTYQYQARSRRGMTNSVWSSAVSTRAPDLTPAVPTGLRATPKRDGAIQGIILLSWNRAAGATTYVLETTYTESGTRQIRESTVSAPSSRFAGRPGVAYTFRVKARNTMGLESRYSGTVTATGRYITPDRMGRPRISQDGVSNYLNLSWSAQPRAEVYSYRWRRKRTPTSRNFMSWEYVTGLRGRTQRRWQTFDVPYEYQVRAANNVVDGRAQNRGQWSPTTASTIFRVARQIGRAQASAVPVPLPVPTVSVQQLLPPPPSIVSAVPPKPEAPTVTPGEDDGEITVSGSLDSGTGAHPDRFDVEYRKAGDSTWIPARNITTTGTSTATATYTVDLAGLEGGEDYEFRVRAGNALGNGDWSDTVTGTPYRTLPPPMPEMLDAPVMRTLVVSTQDGAVTVRWEPVANAQSYEVTYGPQTGAYGNLLDVQSNQRLTRMVTGLTQGTAYKFQVRAIAEGYVSSTAVVENVVAKSRVPTLTNSADFSVAAYFADDTDGRMAVSLGSRVYDGATGYEVQYQATPVDTTMWLEVGSGGLPQYQNGTVGTEYAFRMRAYRGTGDGRVYTPYSTPVTFTAVARPQLPKPSGLSAVASTTVSGRITYSWTAVPNAAGYEIVIGSQTFTTTATTYEFPGVVGTSYTASVKATAGVGYQDSDAEDFATVTGLMRKLPTPVMRLSQPLGGTVRVEWDLIPNAVIPYQDVTYRIVRTDARNRRLSLSTTIPRNYIGSTYSRSMGAVPGNTRIDLTAQAPGWDDSDTATATIVIT